MDLVSITAVICALIHSVSSVCSPQEEEAISKCASSLYAVVKVDPEKYDLFKGSATSGNSATGNQQPYNGFQQEPTVSDDKTIQTKINEFIDFSKDFVTDVCGKFKDFKACVAPYRANCIDVDAASRSQSAAVADGLQYVCGEENDGIKNFQCFSNVIMNRESWECHRVMATSLREQNDMFKTTTTPPGGRAQLDQYGRPVTTSPAAQNTGGQTCRIMQDYMSCLRYPMFRECGSGSWEIVKSVIGGPMSLGVKDCPLSGSLHLPQMFSIVAAALLAITLRYFG